MDKTHSPHGKESISDDSLRDALISELIQAGEAEEGDLIINELGVRHGAARIDVAVLGSRFVGYEIKSNLDRLDRLHEQAEIYNQVFDFITLVVGDKLFSHAINSIPHWWGIKIGFQTSSNGVQIVNVRQPSPNPLQDKIALAELLWREEAIEILERFNAAHGVRSKARAVVYDRLASILALDQLRQYTWDMIKSRVNWRFVEQQMSCGD